MQTIIYKGEEITFFPSRPDFGAYTNDFERRWMADSDGNDFRKCHKDIEAAKRYIDKFA